MDAHTHTTVREMLSRPRPPSWRYISDYTGQNEITLRKVFDKTFQAPSVVVSEPAAAPVVGGWRRPDGIARERWRPPIVKAGSNEAIGLRCIGRHEIRSTTLAARLKITDAEARNMVAALSRKRLIEKSAKFFHWRLTEAGLSALAGLEEK